MRHRILVVDDSAFMRRQVCALFPPDRYDTFEAGDGVDAIVLLRQLGVDLVVSDLAMPRMGGIEFLAVLHATGNRLPVVVLTADDASALAARGAGLASAVLPKHRAKTELVRTVERFLSKPQAMGVQ